MSSETARRLGSVSSSESSFDPPRLSWGLRPEYRHDVRDSQWWAVRERLPEPPWLAVHHAMAGLPVLWGSVYGAVSASNPLMATTPWQVDMTGEELVSDASEYDDVPLEDYGTWRQVEATFVFGSGVPSPMFDPSDVEDW